MSKLVEALRKVQEQRAGMNGQRSHRKIGRIQTSHVGATGDADNTVELPIVDGESFRVVEIDRTAMQEAGLIAPEKENKIFEDE